jgi:hypothetical protein
VSYGRHPARLTLQIFVRCCIAQGRRALIQHVRSFPVLEECARTEHFVTFAPLASDAPTTSRLVPKAPSFTPARVKPDAAAAAAAADAERAAFDALPVWCRAVVLDSPRPSRRHSLRESRAVGEREWTWWAHAGGGNALAFKQTTPVRPVDAIPVEYPTVLGWRRVYTPSPVLRTCN